MKRPIGLTLLALLVICVSLLAFYLHRHFRTVPIIAVLHAQQAAVKSCTPHGQLLLFPYAKKIAQIDATACPDDFFHAWQKYVSDVQTLAAIRRAEAGNAIVSVGVALLTENPSPLLGAIPKNGGQAEIELNTAVADWQNVKHVALRYGIKFKRLK